MQLPHIDASLLKHFSSGKKNIRSIVDFVQAKDDERRAILRSLTEEQYVQVMAVAQSLPFVKIDSVDFKGTP